MLLVGIILELKALPRSRFYISDSSVGNFVVYCGVLLAIVKSTKDNDQERKSWKQHKCQPAANTPLIDGVCIVKELRAGQSSWYCQNNEGISPASSEE